MLKQLGNLNRVRTSNVAELSEEALNEIVTVRNAERKKSGNDKLPTYIFMNREQLASYRNNVISAIERNEGKLNGTIRSGGIPKEFTEELIAELLEILNGVDAKLDAYDAEAAEGEPFILDGLKPLHKARTASQGERVADNFDHIPLTVEQLRGAKVVRAFNHKENERFEVIDETADMLIVVKLTKDGRRYLNRKAFALWKSHIVEVYVANEDGRI